MNESELQEIITAADEIFGPAVEQQQDEICNLLINNLSAVACSIRSRRFNRGALDRARAVCADTIRILDVLIETAPERYEENQT